MSKPIQQVLHEAKQATLARSLGTAIRTMVAVYELRPSLFGHETFETLRQDHTLMLDYLLKGFADDQRAKLYDKLLHRLHALISDLEIAWRCKNVGIYADAFRHADRLNLSPDFVREVLERFVGDVTMLSLEDEQTVGSKRAELYQRHQTFMDRLFCSFVTACQWSEDECLNFARIILLPTIDTNDALLMVSGISLSAIWQFDFQKSRLLATVYKEATDTDLRQRALVGLVFSLRDSDLFREAQQALVRELHTVERFEGDLVEFQKQVFYCLNADRDNETIQKDIMPNIIKNSNVRVTRFGIEEKEPDAMEDILHPDAEDKAMEAVEKSMDRMRDMMMAGSDVFFGGFSQMKRFPFFGVLSNWFTPYYIDHPAISTARTKLDKTGFLNVLFQQGSFCESDKYSMTLGMAQVIDHIPASMREMLGNEEAFGQMEADGTLVSDSRSRRTYLQDLYRFFRLYPNVNALQNPFSSVDGEQPAAFFLLSPAFSDVSLDGIRLSVARFLYRKRMHEPLARLMQSFTHPSAEYSTLAGLSMLASQQYEKACEHFKEAIAREPDVKKNIQAMRGLATSCMRLQRYKEACDVYERLLALRPDDTTLLLHQSIAMLESGMVAEAVERLFKLNYLHPDDRTVMRVLAWGLLLQQKTEQAERYYKQLLSDTPTADDQLNAGYSAWVSGNASEACDRFVAYLRAVKPDDNDKAIREAFARDNRMLSLYEKSLVERQLMIEAVVRSV